ncbi:hypothetical protein BGZ94_005495 [Podila epigama]|nr:hypothetical protein BGZ94_005495 [Podila epigama]
MSETMDPQRRHDYERPKSNIRIGLDPYQNGLSDVLSSYPSSSGLGRRPSDSKQQNVPTSARAGHARPAYPRDALLTEQDMAEALESDTHKRINASHTSNWPVSVTAGFGPQGIISTHSNATTHRSPSTNNHILYIPPPLPPITLVTSPSTKAGKISPYADEAMIVFPPNSPPPMANSPAGAAASTNLAASGDMSPSKTSKQRVERHVNSTKVDSEDEDEPSILQLDNTLTVDRYTKSANAKDRASVSSFFSTLALDPEPAPKMDLPPLPEMPPPSLLSSEEFIIPTPVARRAPRPSSPMNMATKDNKAKTKERPSPSLATQPRTPSATRRAERKREESQIAACFAQDLGFEIIDPSPAMTTPRKHR